MSDNDYLNEDMIDKAVDAHGQWNDSQPPALGEAPVVIFAKADGAWMVEINHVWTAIEITQRGTTIVTTLQDFVVGLETLISDGFVKPNPNSGKRPSYYSNNNTPSEPTQQGEKPATVTPSPMPSGSVDYVWPAGYEWTPLQREVGEGLAKGLQLAKAGNEKTKAQLVRYVAGVKPFNRDGKISLSFVNSEGMEIFKFYDNSTNAEDAWKNPLDTSKHWNLALLDTIRDVARRSPGKIVRFNGFVAYTQKRKDDGSLYPPTFSRIHFADESNVQWQVVNS